MCLPIQSGRTQGFAPTKNIFRYLLFIFFLSISSACSGADTGARHVALIIQTQSAPISINAEIANTPQTREKGLMFRKHLPEHEGMFFVWVDDVESPFWMKNTPLPLDIIFFNSAKTIVHIAKNAKPFSLDYIDAPKPYRYVLEINGGMADRWGVKEGDVVKW